MKFSEESVSSIINGISADDYLRGTDYKNNTPRDFFDHTLKTKADQFSGRTVRRICSQSTWNRQHHR